MQPRPIIKCKYCGEILNSIINNHICIKKKPKIKNSIGRNTGKGFKRVISIKGINR